MNDNRQVRRLWLVLAIGAALLVHVDIATAQGNSPKELSATWWQWAVSIPTPVNPQLDATGANCMVGQSGPIWFLAGVSNGGSASRQCSVPSDKALFFPVINFLYVNTPGVCGQDGDMSVSEMRALAANGLSSVTNRSVELDGKPIHDIMRIRSEVFAIVLPEDNVFNAPCEAAGLGDVPAGVYSPSVDDGLYVKIEHLKDGPHTLHFRADASGFSEDVTYDLEVVPVSLNGH